MLALIVWKVSNFLWEKTEVWTIIGLRPKLRNIILTSNRKLDRWKFRGYQNNRQNSVSRSESCSKIILSSIDKYSVSDQNLMISFLELLVYQNNTCVEEASIKTTNSVSYQKWIFSISFLKYFALSQQSDLCRSLSTNMMTIIMRIL